MQRREPKHALISPFLAVLLTLPSSQLLEPVTSRTATCHGHRSPAARSPLILHRSRRVIDETSIVEYLTCCRQEQAGGRRQRSRYQLLLWNTGRSSGDVIARMPAVDGVGCYPSTWKALLDRSCQTQDFRSADGLYSLVKARYPTSFLSGRDLFSSGLFSDSTTTSLFYTFIAELSIACAAAKPTKTHHFLSKLESKGKLLRSYTQNVDGLERRIGLESGGRGKGLKKKGTRNVELHGDLGRVRCVLCMADFEARREWVEMFRDGSAPQCPACVERCKCSQVRSRV